LRAGLGEPPDDGRGRAGLPARFIRADRYPFRRRTDG